MGREVFVSEYFNGSQLNALSGQAWMTPLVLGITDTQGLAVNLCKT